MISYKNIHIYLAFASIVLLPDIIMSIGGQEPWIINKHDLLFTIAQFIILFSFCIFVWEIIANLVDKKYIKSAGYIIYVIVIFIACDYSLIKVEKKSINEAWETINIFLQDSEQVSGVEIVVDDEVKHIYEEYSHGDNDTTNIELIDSFPSKRRYDFRVSEKLAQPFTLTLYTYKTKSPMIWVHHNSGDTLLNSNE